MPTRQYIIEILLKAREMISGAASKATTSLNDLTKAEKNHGAAAEKAADQIRGESTELDRLHAAHVREKRDLDDSAVARRSDAVAIRDHADSLRADLAVARETQQAHADEASRLTALSAKRVDETGKVDAQSRAYDRQATAHTRLAGEQGKVVTGIQKEVDGLERRGRALEQDARSFERQASTVGRSIASVSKRIEGTRKDSDELASTTSGLRAFFSNVRQGARDSEANLARLSSSFKGFQIAFVIKYAQALLSAFVGLAGSLFSVASAAIQAGVALAGAFVAGAAQAVPVIGLLIAAVSRVTQVFKALQLQQQNALADGHASSQQAEAQRNAANRVADAEESLASAHRSTAEAQRALTDAREAARRELEDLIVAEQKAKVSADAADLSLDGARARLRQAIQTGDTEGVASAQIDIRNASIDQRVSRTDSGRAEADLSSRKTDGSDGLRRAHLAVADAERQEQKAVKNLAEARHDAAHAADTETSAVDRLGAMLATLSPAERALYTSLLRLQETYKKAFRPITDIIIEAFTRAVDRVEKLLGDTKILAGFTKISKAVGRGIDELTKSGTSGDSKSFFSFLTDEASKNIPRVVRIIETLYAIFRNIAKAGAPAFRDLLDLIQDLGDRAEDSTKKTGGLSDYFRRGIVYLRSFLELGLAVVRLFLALSGGGGAADQGLKTIDGATKGIDNLTKKVEGNKDGVKKFFDDSRKVAGEVVAVIGTIGAAVLDAFSEHNVKTFSDFMIRVLVPAFFSVIKIMGAVTSAVHELFALPFVGDVAAWVLATVLLVRGFTIISGALKGLAASIGFVSKAGKLAFVGNPWVLAIAAVIAAVVLLDRKFHFLGPTFEFIAKIAGKAWSGIKIGAEAAWKAIKDGAKAVMDFFSDSWSHGLLSILKLPLELFIKFQLKFNPFIQIIKHAKDIIDFFAEAGPWGKIIDVLTLPFRVMVDIVKTQFSILRGVITVILDLIRGDFGGAKDAFIGIFESMGKGIKNIWNTVFGTIYSITATVVNGIISGVNKAIDVFNKLPGPNIGKISFHMNDNLEAAQTLADAKAGRPTSNIPDSKKAQGDIMRAREGGHRVIVGEEPGYDEAILSSNPRYAKRTRKLLKQFLASAPHVIDEDMPMLAAGGYVQGAISPPKGHPILTLNNYLFSKGYNSTSAFRPGGSTYHGSGDASDWGNSANNLPRLWNLLFPLRSQFAELFGPHAYAGLYHGTQKFENKALQEDHEDHIHVALLNAIKNLSGKIGGGSMALNDGGGGNIFSTIQSEKSLPSLPSFFQAAQSNLPSWLDSVVGKKPDTGGFASGALESIWRQSRGTLRAIYEKASNRSEGTSSSAAPSAVSVGGNVFTSGGISKLSFAKDLLKNLHIKKTQEDLRAIIGWENAEGGHFSNNARFNPLNTTLRKPGSKSINSVGVQSFKSYPQGMSATIDTIRNYRGIIAALKDGTSANAVADAIGNSPWGTNAALIHSAIAAVRLAAGGAVPGFGGGDVHPALLEGGEHIWTKDEVQRAGGHGVMKAMRKMLGGGGQGGPGGYKNGGSASLPFQVTASGPQGGGDISASAKAGSTVLTALSSISDVLEELVGALPKSKKLATRIRRAFELITEDGGPLSKIAAEVEAIGTRGARALQKAQFNVIPGRGPVRTALSDVEIGQRELGTLGRQRTGLEAEQSATGASLDAARKALAEAKKRKDKKATAQATAEIVKLKALQDSTDAALAQNAQDMVEKQEAIQQSILDAITTGSEHANNAIDRQQRLATAFGRALDPSTVLNAKVKEMQDHIGGLHVLAASAIGTGNTTLLASIDDQIAELQTSIAEAAAQQFQNAIDAVNTAASKKLSGNDRAARLAEIGGTNYAAKGSALVNRGQILSEQRSGLSSLLDQAIASGNVDKADELRDSIADLDVTIAENTQAVTDNTDAARSARISDITTQSGFQGGINSGAVQFFKTLGTITGQDYSPQIGTVLAGQGTTLKTENTGLTGELGGLLGYTPGETGALQGMSPEDLVKYLLSISSGPAYDSIMGRLDPAQQDQFRTLVNALLGNANATEENTQAINDNSGLMKTQTFSSPWWETFRTAIFDGSGGLLPQYGALMPRASSGGWVTRDGPVYVHKDEEIVPAGESRSGGDEYHLNVTSPTHVLDPALAAQQMAFLRKTRGR